ncbi:MAG: hypothetical protein H7249_17850 [Chitinophagaceae bacterium]|nr:hypothetical protein [Oligoflexus sp.]
MLIPNKRGMLLFSKNIPIGAIAFVSSFFISCKDYNLTKPTFAKNDTGPSAGNVPGMAQGNSETGKPSESAQPPTVLSLQLDASADNDALVYTFGVASAKLKGNTLTYGVVQKRSILSGAPLSVEQRSDIIRLCRDIGLSSKPDQYLPAKTWDQEAPIYLMWRSHYASDVKTRIAGAATTSAGGIRCAVDLELTAETDHQSVRLTFDPIANKKSAPAGVLNINTAISQGLLLPNASFDKETTANISEISDDPKIMLQAKALDPSVFKPRIDPIGLAEQCYTSVSGGKSHIANPEAKNDFKISVSVGLAAVKSIAPKEVGGRLLPECKNLKVQQQNETDANVDLSCAQYQAVKDAGLEAGCAWELTISNKSDPEDTIAVSTPMNKLVYKTVNSSDIAKVMVLIPRSKKNPVRNGTTKLIGFNQVQQEMMTDSFDLWLNILPAAFDRDFGSRIKQVSYAPDQPMCKNGFAAYAGYGATEFFWCPNGGMTEGHQAARDTDPATALFRGITLYHETRHTMFWKHDHDDTSYAPCAGTAASSEFYYNLYAKCDTDFCRVLRDDEIRLMKVELNYDYTNDGTGRKSQGICKTWTKAMGIDGEGF